MLILHVTLFGLFLSPDLRGNVQTGSLILMVEVLRGHFCHRTYNSVTYFDERGYPKERVFVDNAYELVL
jgi:hypothetical protein